MDILYTIAIVLAGGLGGGLLTYKLLVPLSIAKKVLPRLDELEKAMPRLTALEGETTRLTARVFTRTSGPR